MQNIFFIIIAVAVPLAILILGLKIIPQHKRAIVERFGKYNRYLNPGLTFVIPFIEWHKCRDIRSHTLDIESQPVITKDNVEIVVDGIIWARPYKEEEAIKKTYYNIDDWKDAIQELAQTNLRQEFGNLSLDDSLTSRKTISDNLKKELDEITDEWGIKVDKIEIKLIDPPQDIKNAMHLQKTAEQKRRATVTEALGREEAAAYDKKAQIQKAEGEKAASVLCAEGRAQAIEKVNKAADAFFVGNAVELKKLEAMQNALSNNSKIILTDKGISPNLLIGSLTNTGE